MKRFFSVLMILCLLSSSACAESLQERVGAPAHVELNSTSPSGRSHVYTDATVTVPEAEAVPVYEVFPSPADEMCVKRLGDLLFGEGGYTLSAGVKAADAPAGFTYAESSVNSFFGQYKSFDLALEGTNPAYYDVETDQLYLFSTYSLYDAANGYYDPNSMQYYVNQGDNTGRNVPTEAEARRMADELVSSVFPGFTYDSREKTLNETSLMSLRCGYISKSDDYGYRFYYTRVLDGIPVSLVSTTGGRDDSVFEKGRTNFALPYERLFVDVGEHGLYQVYYASPIILGDKLLDDCDLLPFEQILHIFDEIAPLSIAPYESARNNALYVEEIRLGYMCVPMRDQPQRYHLIPVWDFYGARTIDNERYDEVNNSVFTINAMDGTVIDRIYGY